MQKFISLISLVFLALFLPEMAHSSSAPATTPEESVLVIAPSTAPTSAMEAKADKKKNRVGRLIQKRIEKKLTKHVKSTTAMDRGLKSALIWGISALILASIATWLGGLLGLLVGLVALVVLIIALLKFLGWLSTQ